MSRKKDSGIISILYAFIMLFYIPASILILIFKAIVIIILKIFSVNNVSAQEIFLGEDEKSALEKIDSCEGREFEFIIADLLKYNNFKNIDVTKGSKDYGADIIATLDDDKYAIQCKRYDNKVNSAPIGETLRAMNKYNCNKGIVITNNFFTKQAIEEGKINNIILWDRNTLIKLIINKFENDSKNKKQKKTKKVMQSQENIVILSAIIALCVVIAIIALTINIVHNENIRQATEVGYQFNEYGDFLKENMDIILKDTKYSLYHMNGSGNSTNYYLIEIISEDNKFSEKDVKHISKEIYEACGEVHYKKSGLLDEESIQIFLHFETTNKYPESMTTSGVTYKVEFDTEQSEEKVEFESAVTIEK